VLARKIVSIHPVIVTIFWIVCGLVSPFFVLLGDRPGLMAATLMLGAAWSGWMWAIYSSALQAADGGVASSRRGWFFLLPILASLPLLVLPEGEQETGGAPAFAANLIGFALVGSGGFCLWKTAEALERLVGPGSNPPKLKIFSTMVLLGMVYIAPFVVARRFAARTTAVEALA
jgi:hypothetical protein